MRCCNIRLDTRFFMAALAAAAMAVEAFAAPPWRPDYATAVRDSASSGRPLVVFLHCPNCVWCKKLEKSIDDTAVQAILERTIPVKIDGSKEKALMKSLGVHSYPTIIVAKSEGTIVWNSPGYRDAKDLAELLRGLMPPPAVPPPADLPPKQDDDEEQLTEPPTQNFGVDLDKLGQGAAHKLIRGGGARTITRSEAFEILANGLPDDLKKSRITIIGSDAERKPAEAEYASPANADLRDKTVLWSVPSDHWSVKDAGFVLTGHPTIYAQAAAGETVKNAKGDAIVAQGGEVLHRQDDFKPGDFQAIRRALPDYDATKDPDRRKPSVAKLRVRPTAPSPSWSAGQPIPFTVAAVDAAGDPVAGYTGPVKLSCATGSPAMPPELQLAGGVGSFSATFAATGSHVITAVDSAAADIAGTSDPITITITNVPPSVLALGFLSAAGAATLIMTRRKR